MSINTYPQTLKRALDLMVAMLLAVIFLPIWIVVPILVKLTSPGRVLYSHKRVGQNGTTFAMFKFRSMVLDADDILHKADKELLEKFKAHDWKLEAKDDPRITPLGRILRALTIDEFPQLLNVFRGEMSMVGPRAYLQRELDDQLKKYPGSKADIKVVLTAKPGITGLWQVSGRNEVTFDKRAALDAEYVKGASLWKDLMILLKTPKAMISKW
jgi:lipopolysaccharide/colanic/teichoic acid biosynthesis glycosyltransferase